MVAGCRIRAMAVDVYAIDRTYEAIVWAGLLYQAILAC